MPESSAVDLSVIIVNWNTGQLLSDCLAALHAETNDLKCQTIIVDNNSSDDSIAKAKQLFPQDNYIENDFNGGFAKANNQGIAVSTGNYILFLNPDTKVQKGSVHRLMEFMEQNPSAGIAGGKLVYPDGRTQVSHYTFPTYRSYQYFVSFFYLNPYNQAPVEETKEARWAKRLQRWGFLEFIPPTEDNKSPNTDSNKPGEIDYPVGACFLVRKEVIEQIGRFDEGFFLYCEETDFCLRAHRKGWKIYSVPDAVIIHYAGASTGKAAERRFQIWARSQYLYMRKHFGWITALKTKFLLYRFQKVFIDLINSISRG